MGAKSRRKGARGELEVVHKLRAVYPDARRSCVQERGGQMAPDVDRAGPWWTEVKRQKAPNPWAALAQAERDRDLAGDNRLPVAWCTRDGGEAMVSMRPETFLEICKALRDGEEL